MTTFILMHETVKGYDAIGNDIELMYKIINEKHKCYVYAIHQLNKSLKYITEDKLDEYLQSEDTVIIYHHSTLWEHGFEKIKRARGKVIIKYHNITPEKFFEPYNVGYYNQCRDGRKMTLTMQKELPDAFWVSDSRFNAEDLTDVDKSRMAICPPFNKIEEWHKARPDAEILDKLKNEDCLKLLFVGRIVPNKGYFMLLNILRDYCSYYDRNIKLRIVGRFDTAVFGFKEIILDLIRSYNMEDLVEFIGEVNDNTLMAYYKGSDVMLCCSEHEGFCVPVIEAQSLGLPVVARSMCAVPDTIGQDQLLFGEDTRDYVAALHYIRNNDVSALKEAGLRNYEENYTYSVIRSTFISQIRQITGVEL